MEHVHHHKIAVVGTGPAGLIAALALHSANAEVISVGPAPAASDARTTALMMPAVHFLEKLGVWNRIAEHATSLKTMRIVDGTTRLIRGSTVTFRASEIGEEAFGYNIPNIALNRALATAMTDVGLARIEKNVGSYHVSKDHISVEAADGEQLLAGLVVAADGRSSLARESAGIGVSSWKYPQTAIVLSFSHAREHENISTEFHTEHGPFTQVPLAGRRSSLVWVVNPAIAAELLALDDKALSQRIESRMQSMLGKVSVEGRPQAWPLSGLIPTTFAKNRTILIGEAAHVFPPIGAQGLNLGIRDVEALIDCFSADSEDAGEQRNLEKYNRSRRVDILARTGSVDILNRSLLTDLLPAQLARGIGLEALRTFSPLRAFMMREGLRPGSGFSALSLLSRK
ncbi:MAG: UbiH/UbiF family hydroxylase [Phyllobacterium sp.]